MLAASTDTVNLDQLQKSVTPKAPGDLGQLISQFLPYVFYISGFLLLIYLVLGGFQLMTSRGDPKAVSAAQAKITNALIGFVVILLSAGIVVILGTLLNVEVFSEIF
jgi:hypothetical protein